MKVMINMEQLFVEQLYKLLMTTLVKKKMAEEFETEIKELDTIHTSGAETFYANIFQDQLYGAFGKLLEFAKEFVFLPPIFL